MTNIYDTTAQPLGSPDLKVLANNASNLDEAMQALEASWLDRFGRTRRTWSGFEADFSNLLLSLGYQNIGDYAAGLTIGTDNQIFRYMGEYYRAGPSLTLPYTLTGTWATDSPNFVSVGDAVLRSDLASSTNLNLGAALIGRGAQVVNSMAELRTLSGSAPGSTALMLYHTSIAYGGGGIYKRRGTAGGSTVDNNGTVVQANDGTWWDLVPAGDLSVAQFGALGDGATDATARIQACINAAGANVYIPPGTFVITGTLNFRTAQTVYGAGITSILKYQAVTPAANTAVLSMSAINDATVRDLRVMVDPNTYATARVQYMSGCTDCLYLRIDLVGGGGNAGYLVNCTRSAIRYSEVDDFRQNGFMLVSGSNNEIDHCKIPNGSGGLMGIQLVSGTNNRALWNYIAKSPDNYFGIHSAHCNEAEVAFNFVLNTRREAIAMGGAAIGFRCHHNWMLWSENLGVGDFGMSIAGDSFDAICGDWEVTDNFIFNSALSGIGIAGFSVRGIVSRNQIRDCCQLGGSGFQQGVKLYGYISGAIVTDVVVSANTISKISGGGMLQGGSETAELGSVSSNVFRDNQTVGLTGSPQFSVTGANSVVCLNSDDLLLRTHINPVTSTSGAIGSATGTMRYQEVGKALHVADLLVSVPSNGSGAGFLQMALPKRCAGGMLNGGQVIILGNSCKAGVSGDGNYLVISTYSNGYPGANGEAIRLSGILMLL